MSGILGGINIDIQRFEKAGQLLHHRGPSGYGEFVYNNLYFYHRRLNIQDAERGKQPFHYREFTIIFNGVIFNHFELRTRYNLICRTNSDAETILQLYEKFGSDSFSLLDGMFSIALFNAGTNKLLLVRDRAGEKPLYIFKEKDKFIFCSELNALKNITDIELEPHNIYQYLRYSFIGRTTPYKNTYEIPAGSWYEIDIKTLESVEQKWWKIEDYYEIRSKLNFADALEKTDEILHKSISSRLINSDPEVGIFLSGGIDSSLIASIASKYKSDQKAFTITLKGQYDESSLAEVTAKKYNINHTIIEISFSDLQNRLEKILTNYGEPFADSSAIPSYYAAMEAKKYINVIINGDGADELFGGYRRYVPFSWCDFFKNYATIRKLAQCVSYILPFPGDKKQLYNYIYRLIDFSQKDPLQAYLSATVDTFEGFTKYFNSQKNYFSEIESFLNILNQKKLTGLQKIMCLDFNFILANDLLVKMDIATMVHSMEGRAPFFNKELLEFAPTLNDNYKIRGITTKYILRTLAKRYLPGILINQPKRGFEVPLRLWMENDLKEITYDYLSGKTFSEIFIKKKFIEQLKDFKVKVAPEKRAKMLWRLLALEIWYRKCYLA